MSYKRMQVTLIRSTDLQVCSDAIRTCHQSFKNSDEGGPKDIELIDRVGNQMKHSSTLEHLVYTFYIQGISRAVLQEFARHRIASLSVKSTRYTLKELQKEESFFPGEDYTDLKVILPYNRNKAMKYVVLTDNEYVNTAIVDALDKLRELVQSGIPNDKVKYAIPDAYKTELHWTINARSLQSFLWLRTSGAALWEIRDLANLVYDTLPDSHKYIYKNYIHTEE